MSAQQISPLSAFAAGSLIPIEAVPDPVFAGRMMGDGVAIDPSAGVLYAPCDGFIAQLHGSRHACILETADGARMLLHIGIDTVLLKGEGFTAKVAQGESVSKGQALIEFDLALIAARGKPAITLLVVENGDSFQIAWRREPGAIRAGDALLSLTSGQVGEAQESAGVPDNAASEESANGWATVRHAGGLHARPCALLANAVKPFAAAVSLVARGQSANVRSATAIMALGVAEGEEVEIRAAGPGAGDALEALIIALETASASEQVASAAAVVGATGSGMTLQPGQLAGVTASPGLAVGVTVRFEHGLAEIREHGDGEVLERRALAAALQAVSADIESAVAEAEQHGLVDQAAIFAAHRTLVDDPDMLAAAERLISAGKGASFSWRAAVEAQCAKLNATGIALLAGRVVDLRDIERQVLRKLSGDGPAVIAIPPRAIVLADDFVPSDFAALARAGVAAIVTAQGGPTSHIAILARAQGIPALVAVGPRLADVGNDLLVIVDADNGLLDTAPTAERLEAVRYLLQQRGNARAQALKHAQEPAITTDGTRIEIAANIATAGDAVEAVQLGAESVGLLRTELLFMERETAPAEVEQSACYQGIVDALAGRRVIIRTLDVGADKTLPFIPMPAEENPALGLRGVRLGLAREALLATQLRAILAVQPVSALRIMLPMVTDLSEIEATRSLLVRLSAEMGMTETIELGVMIETPAAAVLADQLAPHVDFFSVGTNDLTQYTLCMDRTNPALAARVDGLHPAVLRLMAQAVQGAQAHGRWLGVCGALASDPIAVPLLIGLGATELSLSPAVIPDIKAVVRRLDLGECRSVAQSALQLSNAGAVRSLVRASWPWLAGASA